MQPTSVLATVTGRDRPGVTAAFFAALAAHDIDVRDVEQVVIRDRLILTVLFDLHGDTGPLRSSVSAAAAALGMECEIAIADTVGGEAPKSRGSRHQVIMLGHPLRPGAVGHVAQRIADTGSNIETVTQLSSPPSSALEMLVSTPDPVRLRAVLVQAADDTGVDVAVEEGGLRRRSKRLVLLDMDSTLVRDDPIDRVAERAGVADRVAALSARLAAGELGAAESLRQRVGLLTGLPVSAVHEVCASSRLAPGAAPFVRTLRRLGYAVGVVSGGPSALTDRLVAELQLDFAAANELEVCDGQLTGRVVEPILDHAAKAGELRRFADRFGIPLSQTVAVGNGPNDIDLLQAAGLGIAFNAKSAARAAADPSANLPYLDSVLFVLGIGSDDVARWGTDGSDGDDRSGADRPA
jgi:phosphoserine phosphatase